MDTRDLAKELEQPRICPHCKREFPELMRVEGMTPVCPFCDQPINS